jgi:hypothetical protein
VCQRVNLIKFIRFVKNQDSGALFDTPAARSFDGNQWEPIFPLLKQFNCSSGQCLLRITKDEGKFVIVPSNATTFRDEELVADLSKNRFQSFPKV